VREREKERKIGQSGIQLFSFEKNAAKAREAEAGTKKNTFDK